MRVALKCSLLLLCCLWAASTAGYNPASNSMPHCAAECIAPAMSKSSCPQSDMTCLCNDHRMTQESVLCMAQKCSKPDLLLAKNISNTQCGIVPRSAVGERVILFHTLASISGVFVFLRLVSRLCSNTGVGLDDLFIVLTILVAIPIFVMNGDKHNELGTDLWTIPADKITKLIHTFWIGSLSYFLAIPLIKISILCFYLRIFQTPRARNLLWSTIAFVLISGAAFFFADIFQCRPVSYFWTNWDGEHKGTCINGNALGISHSALNIALDFWLLAIPIFQLRNFNMNWRTKMEVGLMFLIGGIATVFTILRLPAIIKFKTTTNPSWDFMDLARKSMMEMGMGIVCACLPDIRLLLVRLFPRLFAKSKGLATNGSPFNGSMAYEKHGSPSSNPRTPPKSFRKWSESFMDVDFLDTDSQFNSSPTNSDIPESHKTR